MPDLTTGDVAEIKGFLSRTCDDVLDWLPGGNWQPAWQSEAARELSNREIGPNGVPWGEAPVRRAYGAAAIFLQTAADSLRVMADSVNVSTTTYTSGVLARAVVEPGAQAWWLLEDGIGARRRVIRSLLTRAASARWFEKSIMPAIPAVKRSDWGEDQAQVTAYAKTLGLSYTCNSKKIACEGELLPAYTDRANGFGKILGMNSEYCAYAGTADVERYAVMQGWRDISAPDPPGTLLERRPDQDAVWNAVTMATGFVLIPALQGLTYLDWRSRIKQAHDTIHQNRTLARRMSLPHWSWQGINGLRNRPLAS
jgi:hypothetical protein